MKQKVKLIISHPLISGSSIVFIGSFIANIFNYFFNLSMGRLLSVSDYGLLITLSSLLILLGVFQLSFSNIFAKFSARFYAKNDHLSEKKLITIGFKNIFLFSCALLFVLFVFLFPVSSFLHIENKTLIGVMYITIFFAMLFSLPSGFLQGNLRFFSLSFFNIIQPVIKLGFGVLLVFLGIGVFGAVTAILMAAIVATIGGYVLIYKKYTQASTGEGTFNEKVFSKEFTHYAYTFFLASLGITLLTNIDIILVRHFFNAEVSGQYAALSLMGRAIFYLTAPINFVFFPLIAQKKERNESLFSTMMLATGVISLLSIALSLIYFVFPNVILAIFFPAEQYKVLAQYLGIFSLYILMFSLAVLFNNFFLSIGKTKVYIFTILAAVLQIILIFLFHNSLFEIIVILFSVSFFLFLAYLVFYIIYGKD